jgi:Zn-dependent protease with chaperone function
MNFFEQQAVARRTSARLVFLMAVAIAGIVLAVDAVVWVATQSPELVLFATLSSVAVIALGSLYRIASLGGGGEPVAQQLGGTLVPESTTEPGLRRLRNVVEEIAIASGVPVPKVYVLEHEAGINAFAAGYSTSDAVIAVTRGRAGSPQSRRVAGRGGARVQPHPQRRHAPQHPPGRRAVRHPHDRPDRSQDPGARPFRRSRGKNIGAILVAALVAMLIGYVGLFFGRMIKAGVSRTREKLADASAVQFTRQTQGLSGALKKIGGLHDGSRLNQRSDAEEVSHMLFGDGVGFDQLFAGNLFATHPPLLERIRALEPGFNDDAMARLQAQWRASPPDGMQEDVALGLGGGSGARLPGVRRRR